MAAAISIEQTLSKAIRSIPIAGTELLRFHDLVRHYLHELDALQYEEQNKRLVGKLLEQLFYDGKNAVNSANPIDLAIFTDAVANDSRPIVLFEVKHPTNPEMVRLSLATAYNGSYSTNGCSMTVSLLTDRLQTVSSKRMQKTIGHSISTNRLYVRSLTRLAISYATPILI